MAESKCPDGFKDMIEFFQLLAAQEMVQGLTVEGELG